MKDAEANAEADKAAKESVEVKNNAEQLVYQAEKQMTEMGEQVPAELKTQVEEQIAGLKAALEANDTVDIKTKTEAFTALMGQLAQAAQAGAPEGGPAPEEAQASSEENDGAVDADYEVVDEDKK